MKRFMTLALALVMVLGMFVPSLAPIAKAADEAAAAKHIYKLTPVMDGDLTEWGAPTETVSDQVYDSNDALVSETVYGADFWFAWDESYIYAAFRVPKSPATCAYMQFGVAQSEKAAFGFHPSGELDWAGKTKGEDYACTETEDAYFVEMRYAQANTAGTAVELVSVVLVEGDGGIRVGSQGYVGNYKSLAGFSYTLVNSYAAGIAVAPAEVRVDGTVTATVTVEGKEAFAASEVTVTYDATKLEYVEDSIVGLGVEGAVTAADGTLTIIDAGAEKAAAAHEYEITFKAIADTADTTTAITLDAAAFGTVADAAANDLTEADILTASAEVTILKKEYTVEFPAEYVNYFDGASTVIDGADYIFTATKWATHEYGTVTYKMGDAEAVEVVPNENGVYTITGVNGNLVISATPTAKTFSATVTTIDATTGLPIEDESSTGTATYGQPYAFTLPDDQEAGAQAGWEYALTSVTIGGEAYTSYTSEERVYTIPGMDVTGDIVVTITKSTLDANTFTVSVSGTGDAQVVNSQVILGGSAAITLIKDAAYTYTVEATMGDVPVAQENIVFNETDNTYTIANVTDDVVFTVTKTLDITSADANVYVDNIGEGQAMYLVTIGDAKIEGKTYTFNGAEMFWSEKYSAYSYLVIGTAAPVFEGEGAVTIDLVAAENVVTIAADEKNVNKSQGGVDANDAQFVYNTYNAEYSEFTGTVTMEKLLLADVNADALVDTLDAQVIVNFLLA